MRNLLVVCMVSLLALTFTTELAFAKRFGGGRSFGVQRQSNHYSAPYKKAGAGITQKANPSRWGGILGGLLVGGLLASLFMHHGFASGLLSWLLLGLAALVIIRLFRRVSQGSFNARETVPPCSHQSHQSNREYQREAFSADATQPQSQAQARFREDDGMNFDADQFLRDAKLKFIRLQEAYDRQHLNDIREFTTPEVFAEIKMQLDEQENVANKTDVTHLNATLLDVSAEANLVSVHFTGTVSENGISESLNEVWHFRQYGPHNWLVCGLQQSH